MTLPSGQLQLPAESLDLAKAPWRDIPFKSYVPRDKSITSAMMSRVRARDNKAELLLRKELWRRGFRYRLHLKRLIGKPDLVFIKAGLIIFVDGDFWHGRALIEEGIEGLRRGLRTERCDWWIAKIQRTVDRDLTVTHALQQQGWDVERFWESSVLMNYSIVADEIQAKLEQQM